MKAWKRLPSVMTGGKPYFYTRYDADTYPYTVRQCIVWDRAVRAYRVEHNDKLVGLADSVPRAKYMLDNFNHSR